MGSSLEVKEVIRLRMVLHEGNSPYEWWDIKSPDDMFNLVRRVIVDLGGKEKNYFFQACLSTKNQVLSLYYSEVEGFSSIDTRHHEIFKKAIMSNSASMVTAYVSSNIPVRQDKMYPVRKMRDLANLIGIDVLDYVFLDYGKIAESSLEQGIL